MLELAPNSPLAEPEPFAERLEPTKDRPDFLKYIQEMREARVKLYDAMERDLPFEILKVQIKIVRNLCAQIRLQVQQMRLLLRISELQLAQLLRGQGGPSGEPSTTDK